MKWNAKSAKIISLVCEMLDHSKSKTCTSAYIACKVTGNTRAIEWKVNGKHWSHLRNIHFSILGPWAIIDVLIWVKYLELHRSLKQIPGKLGEAMAKKTPLGWTYIEPLRQTMQDVGIN